jgi:hypothetical protein
LRHEMVRIGIDNEDAWPGHLVFLRADATTDAVGQRCTRRREAINMPSSDAWSAVCREGASERNGTIRAFFECKDL